jgi:uncharacterized protein (DUF849 family)
MFITAAPVGAVPRHVSDTEPKYIPDGFTLARLDVSGTEATNSDILRNAGWKSVEAGGLLLEPGGDLAIIPDSLLEKLPSAADQQEMVLTITASGWRANEEGSLLQTNPRQRPFLHPRLVNRIRQNCPQVLETLANLGWRAVGPGLWNPMRAASPEVPITSQDIAEASIQAAAQGASVIHLHTRDTSDTVVLSIKETGESITLATQRNHIDVDQFERIVCELHQQIPSAIINLSTSVRGGANFESPLRRAHLHGYGLQARAPDVGSFSPGPVIFQMGGGYENPPLFLDQQFTHFKLHGVRPEVEVFNHNILEQALGPYWQPLQDAGGPVLFMLVAGVDQHRRTADGGLEDDSLIPTDERKEIFRLLLDGSGNSLQHAVERTVACLKPVVARIREHSPDAIISSLMPGPMLQILPNVAVALGLDGVRVGLEDALNVPDDRVPGGVRKCTTADQVRYMRLALQALGVRILTAEETRERLQMPTPECLMFRIAANALRPLLTNPSTHERRPIAHHTLAALRDLQQSYTRQEVRLVDHLQLAALNEFTHPCDARLAAERADFVMQAIAESGLYVRYFIEERDRYPKPLKNFAPRIYPLQALNFARELMAERGMDTAVWDSALRALAMADDLDADAYVIGTTQFKGADLRFLEYLVSIPCRYNRARTLASNTVLRFDECYSDTMAILFDAIYELTCEMRKRSNAEVKQAGTRAFQVEGKACAELKQEDALRQLAAYPWAVLPSTPTTNYPEGIVLGTGLISTFARFLSSVAPRFPGLIGFVHSGLNEHGDPITEPYMLNNRFTLNTHAHQHIISHPARLLYEQIMLPRLVARSDQLKRRPDGLVERDGEGKPLDLNGRPATRLSFQGIEDMPRLHLLAHSSGAATLQQMDNAMRHDLAALGYSALEQDEIFNRAVAVSFGSASDVNIALSGTPIVDITAYNDIRSLAGTTTPDYLPSNSEEHEATTLLLQQGLPEAHSYDKARWAFHRSGDTRRLLRMKGVVLREDPARAHDGHSIRRYLEGAPSSLKDLLTLFHDAPLNLRADMLMREFHGRQQTA